MTFDAAPVTQALSVPSPAPPPVPSSNQNTDSGMTFDAAPVAKPLAVQTSTQQAPAQSSYAAETFPTGRVSAVPNSTTADHVKNWATAVAGDLRNGTSITTLGALLHKLGANGIDSGVSPGVADFMGSLPLGLLRATKGGAEVATPGQRWQGVKDTVGGALDATQIPGGFASPVAGELAGQGGEAILSQAERAANGAKGFVSLKSLQPKIQGAITSAIQDAAAEHGVSIPDGTTVRDVTQTLSNALRSKAHDMYASLDTALGGTRFQSFEEAIDNVSRAIRDEVGLDPARDKQLADRLADAKAARDAAIEQLQAKGIDPATIDQADALHRRAMALQDVSKAVRASTDVHPSQLASGADNTAATNVRTKPLWNRLQQLATPNPKYPGTPSRLVQAIGEDRAAQLLHDVDAAHLAAQKIAARNVWIRRGASAAGLTGAGAAGYHFAHELLGGQ